MKVDSFHGCYLANRGITEIGRGFNEIDYKLKPRNCRCSRLSLNVARMFRSEEEEIYPTYLDEISTDLNSAQDLDFCRLLIIAICSHKSRFTRVPR